MILKGKLLSSNLISHKLETKLKCAKYLKIDLNCILKENEVGTKIYSQDYGEVFISEEDSSKCSYRNL